jgi:hypothetical protein
VYLDRRSSVAFMILFLRQTLTLSLRLVFMASCVFVLCATAIVKVADVVAIKFGFP